MKTKYPKIKLGKLCSVLGITRQAYYQHFKQEQFEGLKEEMIIQQVFEIRKNHPRIGTRKLYVMLSSFLKEHQLKLGRDALFELLNRYGLLIRKRKRKVKTTLSHHWLKKHPNLIKEFTPTQSNQLYVSDITYWKTDLGFLYISLITDAFSRKIVGYHLAETLEAVESIHALKMALNPLEKGINLIHHSDRGVQYCSEKYINILQDYQVQISMTENGDPLENALAERVNGILKEEYLIDCSVGSFTQAKELLDSVVQRYNLERPHMSIGNLTPEEVHTGNINTKKLWKSYYEKTV